MWVLAIPAAQVHLLIPQLLQRCPHNKNEAARCSSISTEYKRNLVKNEELDNDMRTIRLGEKGRGPNSSQIFVSDSLDTNFVEWSGHREEEYSLYSVGLANEHRLSERLSEVTLWVFFY